ncbi:MAG: HNH endonuclease [Elusimicrobia bacterium]|nr:HNH endonuclease [Elusimicrobiota bacterium]
MDDSSLIAELESAVPKEREALVEVLTPLMEFDRRKLYAEEGFYSLFLYCTRALGYSEQAAFQRTATARTARSFPQVLELLQSGALHMNAVVMLAPYLMEDNCRTLFTLAQGKSRRELEFFLAGISPRPDKPDYIRPISASCAPCAEAAADPRESPVERPAQSLIEPASSCRVRFAFTGSETLLRKIERAKQLLRHKHPDGSLERIIEESVDMLLDKQDPERRILRKALRPEHPNGVVSGRTKPTDSGRLVRDIPQQVKDAVWQRDGGCCAFIGPDGKRCAERGMLEYDHIRPYSMGGASDDPANIRLLCRTHNQMFARRMFGEQAGDPRTIRD